MVDLSIVIVNYKNREKALNCLRSIYDADFSNYTFEVILIDNYSCDEIEETVADKFPQVNIIQSGANLGMGKGNNVGIEASKGKYILILNPDTVVEKDAIRLMCDKFIENDEIGMIGPKLLYPDGVHQYSYFMFPELLMPIYRRTPLGKIMNNKIDKFLMKGYDIDNEIEVDWLMGSCLLTSRDVIDKVGMFDDRFFMYFEDTDLCKRFKKINLKVVYYPKAVVYHHHGRASAEESWYLAPFTNKLARIHIQSWAKYFWKWKIEN